LRFQVSHPERMVIGVAGGVVTLKDLLAFWRETVDNHAVGYSKIVDVMGGTPMLSAVDIGAFRDRIAELPKDVRFGPLALVTNEEHRDIAALFSEITSEHRPVKVFHSIHDARKWLKTMPAKR
jgi:hypothetical protein